MGTRPSMAYWVIGLYLWLEFHRYQVRFHRIHTPVTKGYVRSYMGAYVREALCRVHLVTVLLRHPSGHRPDRRKARHVHDLQIGLRLAIAKADTRPVMPISLGRPPSGHRPGRQQARHAHILR